jgi:UDP-N-acetylglucosamine 2-epimerase
VGTSRSAIVAAVEKRWHSDTSGLSGETLDNPFGDGQALERIYRTLARRFGVEVGPDPAGLWDWPGLLVSTETR